ncbi:chloride channel protein [Aureivirga marina]|uniref:chloride channel protein n=1 Tax=Aureivirga marina TaxID=1182451 RepID=UPI0018CA20FC|nr:chloride channel protein [Aureivirga marina]
MPGQKKNILTRFLIWRYKNISQRNFVYALSLIIGFLSGIAAVIIKNLTHLIKYILEGNLVVYYHHVFYFVFPLIGILLTILVVKYIFKKDVGFGIPTVLYAISKRKSILPKKYMFSNLITAPLTVGFGGSAGLEGPTILTGASVGTRLSKLLHMGQSTRMLLIGCAAAGAMSSIYKAPITAIIFAVEVFSLDLTLVSLVPLLLASSAAVITSHFFFGSTVLLHFQLKDIFTLRDIPYFILLGFITSLTCIYFTRIHFFLHSLFDKMKTQVKRLLIGGISIGILVFIIPPLYGEGFQIINSLLEEDYMQALGSNLFDTYLDNIWVVISLLVGLVIFKAIATSLTTVSGGVGGIFSPVLFVGSAIGQAFSLALNNIPFLNIQTSTSNFSLVGMAGVMAGMLHAPLTAIFLIAEITGGYKLFIPLMITATISYICTKYFIPHSIYTMQLAKRGELMTHDKDKNVLMMMEIEELIENDFVPVNPEMSLGKMLHEAVVNCSRNIFPVIDEEENFLGVVLLDDIRSIMFESEMYETVFVSEVMRNAPTVIDFEEDSMEKIMQKFQNTSAWNLPVVRQNKYMGFISKSKLLTVYRRKLIEVTSIKN